MLIQRLLDGAEGRKEETGLRIPLTAASLRLLAFSIPPLREFRRLDQGYRTGWSVVSRVFC